MEMDYLLEQVKTIHNLAEIAILLRARVDLLPTILELILVEAQDLNETHCVIRED